MIDTLVKETMTRDVATIRQDCDVHELEKLMLREKVHGVPVVDESGRLVGVVSQTDVLAWHFETGVDGASFYGDSGVLLDQEGARDLSISDIRTATVKEIMSPLVYCIAEDRTIVEAAATMIRNWIHRLVVVDTELQVRGIVSAIDLLHCIPGSTNTVHEVHRAQS
jgi:CBS domain-containing protein